MRQRRRDPATGIPMYDKGFMVGDLLLMPCREQYTGAVYNNQFNIEWCDHPQHAKFWAVYSLQGCIKTWIKDFISHREAQAFAQRWQDALEFAEAEKEHQDRIYDFIQKVDLMEAL